MHKIIAFLFCCASVCITHAQKPVTWQFTAKKIADKTYEIHLTPTVQNPWHIYSQTSPDGGALPTTISFVKNPLATLQGKAKEVGKVVSKFEEVFGITVKYFEGTVDLVQMVKLNAAVKPISVAAFSSWPATTRNACPRRRYRSA